MRYEVNCVECNDEYGCLNYEILLFRDGELIERSEMYDSLEVLDDLGEVQYNWYEKYGVCCTCDSWRVKVDIGIG